MATTPSAAASFSQLDPSNAWLLFDPSPEAQIAWAEAMLTIDTVEGSFVDFRAFPQQRQMAEGATGRDITVKGRQTRASSWILARNLRRMTTNFGLKCVVAAQDDQTVGTFRARLKHHIQDLDRKGLHYDVALDNKDELVLGDMENRFLFVSGHESVAGRAYTGHIVHLSEVSHWPADHAEKLVGDILPAVPGIGLGGQFDIESTPNGAEGLFYEYAMDARPRNMNSSWTTHFYPWWLEPRYRAGSDPAADLFIPEAELNIMLSSFRPAGEEEFLMEAHNLEATKILWRRQRKADLAKTAVPFTQEYPEDLDGCFVVAGNSYFASPDGIDHLRHYREGCNEPLLKRESLPYRGGEISFHGPHLSIWHPMEPGHVYAGWVDCAGGGLDEKSDFSAFTVIDTLDMTHVATLWLKAAPDELAPMVAAVGAYYNSAWIGGERDAYGSACLARLKQLQADHIWYYVDPMNPPGPDTTWEAWIHPTAGREKILTAFRGSVFSHRFKTRDRNVVREMSAFTWLKVKSRQAMKAAGKGQHDDLVISVAGACFMAPSIGTGTNAKNSAQLEEITIGNFGLVTRGQRSEQEAAPWMR